LIEVDVAVVTVAAVVIVVVAAVVQSLIVCHYSPPLKAGGHPNGIDSNHAHKISLIYDDQGVGYLYYTAVGGKGRGIALLTSKPLSDDLNAK
jgi:hypothetical protein